MLKGQCEMPEHDRRITFPKNKDGRFNGLWGHALNTRMAFFTNSPQQHQAARGIPKGHIPIDRLLSVPVLDGQELLGQIALANKPADYTDQDLEAVKRIAEFYALAILQRRTRAALLTARNEMEKRVDERTAQLRESNLLLKQKIAAQQMAEEALKASENNLRSLSFKILDAHEEEQKRIGQELHDGVAQTMSAMKIWAESALARMEREDYPEVIKSLNYFVPLSQAAVEEVRRIAKNLRPSMLDDLGILATISWLCNDFENLYPQMRIDKRIEVEEAQIPEKLKLVIFRVLQESMNNIAKHSQAQRVELSLNIVSNQIELKVSDDGVGFVMDQFTGEGIKTAGLGLASMKERVHYSEGVFKIQSQKGTGTRVEATWPVR
jgi:signal transduction histidine kinase